MSAARHLAQVNVGRLAHALDDPRLKAFMDALETVNAIAERSEGFVWRLKGEGAGAVDVAFDDDDPRVVVNLSVWSSVEGFEHFVWRTVHRRFYQRRAAWFESGAAPSLAMWWIEPGHVPSVAEARARLEEPRVHGRSERVFGWDGLRDATQWRDARCA